MYIQAFMYIHVYTPIPTKWAFMYIYVHKPVPRIRKTKRALMYTYVYKLVPCTYT